MARRRRGYLIWQIFNDAVDPYFTDDGFSDAYYFDDGLTDRWVTIDQ